ncbi:Coenzyme F420 hydrogenase/dehydrogenase, beta subunit C-terminal domain [Saccharicrinis sp. FJH62]|uniref:Coenzyme F420 hydrogenase/dehydrogenase, beta subunit C-terminal domain n=1 Tax=Saccharicrinis sp. FJH62 TaxID=3344657 RepID=UPI0035D526E4
MKNNFPHLPSNNKCTGCLACTDICKHNALSISRMHGLRFVQLSKDKCTQCGLCEKVCPINNPLNHNQLPGIKAFEGWIEIEHLRLKSASGGAFTAFAREIINKSGFAIGAMFWNNEVYHKDINSFNELNRLQNSKYLQSNTSGIFNKTQTLLNTGAWVLFSGTSCQVAGLNNFLNVKSINTEKLITVDLLCHGVPSDEALTYHLKKYKDAQIVSFRDKTEGWWGIKSQNTTIQFQKGKILTKRFDRRTDLFYRDFLTGLSSRTSCCNCKFSTLPRYADITIGDFWGTSSKYEDQFKGVSVIFANNKKGADFITSVKDLYLGDISLNDAMKSNPRVYTGFTFIKYHPLILFRHLMHKVLPYEVFHSILINKMPWRLIWGFYRLLTKISEKVLLKKINIKINKVT